jgi:hypothetical protein
VPESDRDRIFNEDRRSKFLWCLHCERTYEAGKWRTIDGLQMCPYVDCSGDAVIDAWAWGTLRHHHPDYPETPTWGQRYPLYPGSAS